MYPTSLSDPARRLRATTILGVRRGNTIALAGDGQVTYGDVVLKHGARKIRTLYDGLILAGFAGAVADALTLFTKFEAQLKAWDGNLRRASVELAKEWRTDRYLRRLEAQLIVGDPESLLVLSGDGDVIEPDDGIAAIGSGAPYATAAAKALLAYSELDARAIVEASMTITADLCIFTNDRFTIETVSFDDAGSEESGDDESADDESADDESADDESSEEDKELPIDGPVPAPATGSDESDEDDDDDDDDDDQDNDDDKDDNDDDDGDPRTTLSRRRR